MDGSTLGVLSMHAVVGYISSHEETGVRADGETSSVQSDADVAFGSHVATAMAACDTEFRNTGLERSEALAKDLTSLKEQGHSIPEPSQPRLNYSACLEELSKNDPQTFICHFYNTYFAHSAGARMIGRKVAEKVFNGNELEFYKWDGDLSQLFQSFRDKLNVFAENWTREEKNHCLEETEESFKYSEEILRLILS